MIALLVFLTLLFGATLLLAKSASVLVASLSDLAIYKKWSDFSASFLLASATSLPELAIGVASALDKEPALSLGNILGSNIANVTLVAGLIAVAGANIRVTVREKKEDSLYSALITLLPVILLANGSLSRLDGAILLFSFFLYLARLYRLPGVGGDSNRRPSQSLRRAWLSFFGGVALLLASSKVLVFSAERVAILLQLPLVLVGLFVVGVGTSLPELFFGIKASLVRKGQMALGDILGSIIFNSGLILGITALIYPIKITNPDVVYSSAIFLVSAIVIFTLFLRTEYRLTRREGIILTLLFSLFTALEFGLGVR